MLANLPKESGSVMDNAAFHKGKDMQKMLEDAMVYFVCLFIPLI
ncbi:hypothetical protein [Holospora undulata]|uniref:Transposase n=1 Tax=Holospora elegans E1 TaxID=1427503 RepID=A0A023DX92_9PROT|nr:hypothetical protein [Holospora undulata]GAJ45968.1 hypothetical protein HE1_00286 [Holospora elegans E1]